MKLVTLDWDKINELFCMEMDEYNAEVFVGGCEYPYSDFLYQYNWELYMFEFGRWMGRVCDTNVIYSPDEDSFYKGKNYKKYLKKLGLKELR